MSEPLPSEEVYHGHLLSVRVKTLPKPSGGQRRYEIVAHPGAVAIVAARREQPTDPRSTWLVALVRQARPAVERDLWELPAGLIERGESSDPLLTAQRELLEETGASAATWHLLAREYSSPGFTDETIAVYLATDVTFPSDARPADPSEIAQVAWLPLDEAIARARRAEVTDGKTLLGLTLAREVLGQHLSGGESEVAMPIDPTNAPMQRSARYREGGETVALDVRGDTPSAGNLDTSLKMENMLLEEYNYANLTAYQALEDRARIFNFYLTIVGILAGALGALYQFGGTRPGDMTGLVLLGLGVITIFGIAFFVKLIRVRQAYSGSVLAMNMVKEYYIAHFEPRMPDLPQAFLWRMKTIPRTERLGSVTFIVCAVVAVMTATSVGTFAGIGYDTWLTATLGPSVPLPNGVQAGMFGVVVAALVVLGHILYYRHALNTNKDLDAATAKVNAVRKMQGLPPL